MMRIVGFGVFGAMLVASVLGACSSAQGVACHSGADCASGTCASNGTCAPPDKLPDAAVTDVDIGFDAGSDAPNADVAPLGCAANGDDIITAAEVPLKPGLHATFRTATNVTVDTAGKPGPNGTRDWDLSPALPGDQNTIVETLPVTGTWYAGSFPTATYATKLNVSLNLLGVFRVSNSALELLGVVSPSSGSTQTNLAFAPPVTTLQFPLQSSSNWSTTATVTGTASGTQVYYSEKYDSQVDAKGTLKTPFGTFPVLRVRIVLTRTIGLFVTVTRTFAFVTDCFGTVAAITSQSDEKNIEFTNAAEVKRIAP